jgi:hypothetical protein
MYRSEIVTFSSTKTRRDQAIEEATTKANEALSQIMMEEVLHYHIQTIYEPTVLLEDGSASNEYYTHIISIVFRRAREEARR